MRLAHFVLFRGNNQSYRDPGQRPAVLIPTIDASGALHRPVAEGFKDVTELWLASKADFNAKVNDGVTPLHYAALRGRGRWRNCYASTAGTN